MVPPHPHPDSNEPHKADQKKYDDKRRRVFVHLARVSEIKNKHDEANDEKYIRIEPLKLERLAGLLDCLDGRLDAFRCDRRSAFRTSGCEIRNFMTAFFTTD